MGWWNKGKADDLGGGVFKKRLDRNRHRSIILAKGRHYWVYAYLFAKKDRSNIDESELARFVSSPVSMRERPTQRSSGS